MGNGTEGVKVIYNILVIDDMPAIHELVKAHLSGHSFEVSGAYDGKTGLITAERSKPDLILLDVDMPVMQGFEVCRHLKARRETRSIPVIFLTAANSVDDRIRGFDAGACDYITKPFDGADLRARVRAALRAKRALDELSDTTMVDEMTQLFDRKYFETQLDAALSASRRSSKPLGVILVDIDKMHAVNGAFGSDLADQMLRTVSQSLMHTCRREDVLCRFGGDVFAVLVRDSKPSILAQYAERIRVAVRSAVLYDDHRVIQVTGSVGVSVSSPKVNVLLVGEAEEAVTRAKMSGGDCVRTSRELTALSAAA